VKRMQTLAFAALLTSAYLVTACEATAAVDIAVTGDIVHAARGTVVLVGATITNLDTQVVYLNGITSGVTPGYAQDDAFDSFASLRPDSLGPGEIWEGPVLELRISPTAPLAVTIFDVTLTGGASPYAADVIGTTYFAVDDSSALTGVAGGSRPEVGLRTSPNPFVRTVGVDFTAPTAGRYEVAVFDVSGRRVALLHSGELAQGLHNLAWDGRRDAGGSAATGVFFVRVTDGHRTLKTKVLKLD